MFWPILYSQCSPFISFVELHLCAHVPYCRKHWICYKGNALNPLFYQWSTPLFYISVTTNQSLVHPLLGADKEKYVYEWIIPTVDVELNVMFNNKVWGFFLSI